MSSKYIFNNPTNCDIGMFECKQIMNDLNSYSFYDASTDEELLKIISRDSEIYEVGLTNDINGALFDVGYEYIGR